MKYKCKDLSLITLGLDSIQVTTKIYIAHNRPTGICLAHNWEIYWNQNYPTCNTWTGSLLGITIQGISLVMSTFIPRNLIRYEHIYSWFPLPPPTNCEECNFIRYSYYTFYYIIVVPPLGDVIDVLVHVNVLGKMNVTLWL